MALHTLMCMLILPVWSSTSYTGERSSGSLTVSGLLQPSSVVVTIPAPAKQASCGVFRKSDGALMRTLWHRSEALGGLSPGPMQVEWDGSIDTHHAEAAEAAGLHSLDPNDYEVRVQASNVSHVWEGVVGNSGPAEGTNVMHSLNWVSNIHTAGNVGLLSTNYNEAEGSMKMFSLNNPHRWIELGHASAAADASVGAFDGQRAYFAVPGACNSIDNVSNMCQGVWGQPSLTFVVAFDLATRHFCEHNFTVAGEFICRSSLTNRSQSCTGDANDGFDGCNSNGLEHWSSGADVNRKATAVLDTQHGTYALLETITSIAVDREARYHDVENPCHYLYTAHPYLNQTRVLHKLTGELVATVTMPHVTALARSWQTPLWAIEAGNVSLGEPKQVVRSYSPVSSACNGSFAASKHFLPNVSEPLAISAIPGMNNDQGHNAGPWQQQGVVVADGGDMTLKVFFPKPGKDHDGEMVMVQQIGEPGGYVECNQYSTTGHHHESAWSNADEAVPSSSVSSRAGSQQLPLASSYLLPMLTCLAHATLMTSSRPTRYVGPDPTVRDGRFYWGAWKIRDGRNPQDGWIERSTSIAVDDVGTVWVLDHGNERIIRFNLTSKEPVGNPVSFMKGSYSSTASHTNTTRVFSNMLEFSVSAALPHANVTNPFPASDASQWTLVRNWRRENAFGYANLTGDIRTVAEVAGKTLALVPLDDGYQSNALCELDPNTGLQVLLVLTPAQHPDAQHGKVDYREVMLNADGSVTYLMQWQGRGADGKSDWTNCTQLFYHAAYDVGTGNWTLPGKLIARIHGKSDSLFYTGSFGGTNFPRTSDGNIVILDASTGSDKNTAHPNQGNHLGSLIPVAQAGGGRARERAAAAAGVSAWKWQASPWGWWNLTTGTDIVFGTETYFTHDWQSMVSLCNGYTVTAQVIDPTMLDGRYGAKDSGVVYAGNQAMAHGDDVVYGFHGEFWHGIEAGQFVHFRNGLYIANFGNLYFNVRKKCGDGTWTVAAANGNSFSPVLVPGATTDEMIMYHNDESQHAGVHRWRITGLDSVTQLTPDP